MTIKKFNEFLNEGRNSDKEINGNKIWRDDMDNTELIYAAQNEDDDITEVKALIEQGIDVNDANHDGTTPLIVACENGNIKIARFLIENGADVNAKAEDYPGAFPSALVAATTIGRTDIVKLLKQHGAIK